MTTPQKVARRNSIRRRVASTTAADAIAETATVATVAAATAMAEIVTVATAMAAIAVSIAVAATAAT